MWFKHSFIKMDGKLKNHGTSQSIPSGIFSHNELEGSTMLFMGKFTINGDFP